MGALLAGGAAAAAAAYGAYQLMHGHHQTGHGMPHFGQHGKFKHGMFGGKHGRFGGKFKKWK